MTQGIQINNYMVIDKVNEKMSFTVLLRNIFLPSKTNRKNLKTIAERLDQIS